MIDSFEQRWYEWNINDTIEWFKFVFSVRTVDDNDLEYSSSDSSNSSSNGDDNIELQDGDDEKKQLEMIVRETQTIEIDFKDIKSNLLSMKFNSKKYFPILLKSFQFERFGFKNKKDQKYLCKKVKQLIAKHPRKKKKTKKKNVKQFEVEGCVQDTN